MNKKKCKQNENNIVKSTLYTINLVILRMFDELFSIDGPCQLGYEK